MGSQPFGDGQKHASPPFAGGLTTGRLQIADGLLGQAPVLLP